MSRNDLRCPVCDGDSAGEIFHSSNGHPIVRCEACGLAFTDSRDAPPPEKLYPAFDQTDSRMLEGVRSALALFLRQRAAFVRSVAPRGRLLDYGCGNGAFARFMANRGYVAVGLEPFSLGNPIQSGRLKLIRAPLEEADLGEFDVITLWHVLEHIARPADLLRQLGRHLAPGGALIVSVPNLESWQGRLFRGQWFHLDAPRHLIHFEPSTLRSTLARAGFEPFAERRFLPEYGSSGWIQSSLNTVLPHKNYLYEVVKDRGALARVGRLSSSLHLAASVLGGVPLFALSLPLEGVASALNRGAALTVAARKRA